MDNENTRREDSAAPRALSRSELQKQVTDFAAQRLAISEVLRAIVSSPHDLQPVLQTIVDSAVHLCRAEGGLFRVVEGQALDWLRISLTPPSLRRQCFMNAAALCVASTNASRRSTSPTLMPKSIDRERLTEWLWLKRAFGRSSSCRCSEMTS